MKPLKKEACVLVHGTKCTHTQYVETPTATQKKRGKCRDKNTGFHVLSRPPQSHKMCAAHGSGSQCDTALPKRKTRAGGGGGKNMVIFFPQLLQLLLSGRRDIGLPPNCNKASDLAKDWRYGDSGNDEVFKDFLRFHRDRLLRCCGFRGGAQSGDPRRVDQLRKGYI